MSGAAGSSMISSVLSPFSMIPTWLLILVQAVYAYYKYTTWHYGIFKKLGINGPKPWPLLGTSYPLMARGLVANDMEMREFGKIVGTFQGRLPMLIIYDVDILKQILVKDFTNFTNRFVPPITDYPLSKMLTMLKGDHWRHVRNIMTPTFSSGKLRKMNDQIHSCSETFVKNLLEKADKNETFDFRDVCGAYTMDVIASTAFSVKVDSHNDPNNQFVQMARKAFMFKFTSPKFLMLFFMPYLMKPLSKLGLTVFPKDVTEFFVNVVNQALDERKHTKAGEKKQVDFLQLMVDAHADEDGTGNAKKSHVEVSGAKENEKSSESWKENDNRSGLTHEEVLAQGLLFFLAGFETTANTLSLLGYSLATNPDAQEKLLKEIDEVMKDKARVDYDVVKDMPYLDMCISETLRLYPAAVRTDRVAKNDCTINGVFIPKDMIIISPIYVLHMDPEVWPNPTKFIPERFTAEEKAARNPYYYMPFGVGPRNCVGMRLALTELKVSAVHILQKMKFDVCSETQIPLVLDKISMKGVNGIKLRMVKR